MSKIVFSKNTFAVQLLIIEFLIFISYGFAKAAPCPTGGSVTLAVSCEINGSANYTDLTITGGAVVSSNVGQKINITATGTVQIDAGSGIDVSGKGNNIAGKGANGGSNGSACIGIFGGGGGGGGYGGVGGAGGTDDAVGGGAGGITYGSNTNPFDLGSPGGFGGGNVAGNGMGGGAIKITASNIILKGYIKANGGNGSDPRANDGSGGGGGGSGGSVWLLASNSFDFTGGAIEAKGGNGGADVNCGGLDGTGGGGGGGRISLQYKGPKIGIGTNDESFGLGGGGPKPGADGTDGTFYENPCYLEACDNYCNGITAFRNGLCDPLTGNCNYAVTQNCADADPCTYDECREFSAECANFKACEGLVPCGRMIDNPATSWNDKAPCDLCFLLLLVNKIMNFLAELAFVIALLALIITGFLFLTSAGNSEKINNAKNTLKWVLIGVLILFLAWFIVDFLLTAWGYLDPLGGKWDVVC